MAHISPSQPPSPPSDLALWRKARRAELIGRRETVDDATMNGWRRAMDGHLERGFPGLARGVVAFCWPYRKEYDARHLAARLRAKGAVTALPVVVAPRTPLIFREWHPGVTLARGRLGIPYPAGTPELSPALAPDAVLLPMVGFDAAGYRLGYGGGFFDRTLGAMERRPAVIGVAHELAKMDTIFPQPHDIAVDYVVTERGIYRREGGRDEGPGGTELVFLGAPPAGEPSALASPVCYAPEFDPGASAEE